MTVPALLVAAVLAAPAPSTPTHPPEPPPQPADRVALRALAVAAAGDPDVASVQAAAAREALRGAAELDGWPGRARLSALLPRITAEVRHDEQSNRTVGLQSAGEVDYLRLTPGTTVLVRATWTLADLVAHRGEIAAATAAAARARRATEAVQRATVIYFERRRLRVALLLAPPEDPLARAQAELEIARLGAELDALTGAPREGGR
ncbi:hypothetical protein [Anaeromyxobacter oryzae]|nr:hypothetical protein [Anaeromyxobacter oryzae]